jgi:hypothetical protein
MKRPATPGIADFALGDRVRFVHRWPAAQGGPATSVAEGEIVSVNHEVGTVDVDLKNTLTNRSQRLIKRPWELEKLDGE